ncbi:MAG: hypothetical protein M0C28_01810 [Candidatus Moduliflexus flocculans]|nr:hypothetical protein [Candidatus Moduliflexus flocculans]
MPDDFSFATSETFIQFYKTATSGIYFAMIAVSSIALHRRRHRHHEHHVRLRVRADARRSASAWPSAPGGATSSSSSSSNRRSSAGLGGLIGIVLGFLVGPDHLGGDAPALERASRPRSCWPWSCRWSIGLVLRHLSRPTGRPSSTRSRPCGANT